ncbi:hypothetical protein F4692_002782 [Nocardioides cavernae]|uniref:Uncharacterized protein n=1 Tax=Nocardioides cavernae TaxID=1921566 RepID=A0A7Y9KSJ1_9ACTN|nr:hypothetical protein [Nocardioides cavernae]NYE37649.1 hypothetical protein [Nocardioides cavernae]
MPRPGSVAAELRSVPRALYLVVGTPSFDHFTLRAVADDSAAGHRVVLQRRTPKGWTGVAARRFSRDGKARWEVPRPDRRITYRAVTRIGGERIVSTEVNFS